MVGFPLLLIPLAVYNIIAFLMPDVLFSTQLFKLVLLSGVEWQVTLSDVLVTLGIFLLMFEVIKGARPGAKYLTDHLLSLIVFGAAAAEFVMWPKFGTSTYFLLTALALADFLSGLALRTRRGASARNARQAEPVVEPVSHRTPERPVMPAEAEQPPSPPKRRSTVREPAPVFTTGQGFTPTSPPQPQASESAASPAEESSDDEGKPRKTGWWAKRILGQ